MDGAEATGHQALRREKFMTQILPYPNLGSKQIDIVRLNRLESGLGQGRHCDRVSLDRPFTLH